MTALSIAGWGLVGLVIASVLRIAVRRSSLLRTGCERLAPPALLEVVTAVLFSALAWRIGAEPDLFAYSWLAAAGVLLAAVDWNSRTLPTKLIWPSGIILATLLSLAAVLNRDAYPLIRSAVGMLALLMFYGALYFLRPGEFGGGDLRLSGLLGLALGWAGWTALLTGTLLGWLAAAIAILVLRIGRGSEASDDIPLGPFLITGTLAAMLVSSMS
ncbi:MAG: prepilin peptidase [Actinophytocola sp.]|uniref:prepilin peptidase n=1 Tax=Actinophytocola sp. TaxID=1872138 RepID=UPI003C74750D